MVKLNGKDVKASRVAYAIVNGEIPADLHVLHKCDNPCCVNPDHLFTGTHQDNMLDRQRKGRGKVLGRASRFHGVAFRKDSNNWRAQAFDGRKHLSLGSFKTEEEAAKARDKAVIEMGLDLPLNFPPALDEQPAAGISQDAHEKEIMMQAFDKVRQIFEGRQWVMDGRGGYPYNDDRYKEEVRYMYDEFDKVTKDTWGNIKSKSIEYKEWIIAEYLQKDHPAIHDILRRLGYQASPATEREEVKIPVTIALFEFVRDCAENWDHDSDAHRHDTICRKCDAKELYKCLKEQKEKAATLTQSRADFIREVNNRDVEGIEAVRFAEWVRSIYQPDEFSLWSDHTGNQYTTAELYELFKQQKEK